MKKIYWILTVIFLLGISIFAQDLSKKSFQTPLECSLFLTIRDTDEYRRDEQLTGLAFYYWQLGRQKDAVEAVELISDDYNKTNERIRYAKEYLKIGKNEEATNILLPALKSIEVESGWSGNDSTTEFLIDSLIKLGKIQEVIDFAESNEDVEEKTFALIQISDLMAAKGNKEKSLELLLKALETIEQSKWEDLKLFAVLKTGNIYAKIGEQKKAEESLEKVVANYQSVEYSNTRKDDFEEQIVELYINLKEFEKALSFLEIRADFNDQENLRKLAELNLKAGKKEKADALYLQIEQMQQSYTDDDDVWSKLIYESIKTKDYAKALDAAKKLSSNNYRLEIVEIFIKQNRSDEAKELLNIILKTTAPIKSNEPESGWMSTSPQMERAIYLSRLAERFAELKQFETALKIVNTIEKPYFKAQALTDLAVKQEAKKSNQLLNQALTIIKNTDNSMLDAKKFDVWCKIAEGFAKIGMKDKALEVFAEILSDENIGNSSLIRLTKVGFYFEKAGLKSNEKIAGILKQFIKNWEEDN